MTRDELAGAVRSLALSPDTMAAATERATAAGDAGLATRHHVEWLNDLLPAAARGEGEFTIATANPDRHFTAWFEKRLAQPYHVSYRFRQQAVVHHGAELSVIMGEMRWKQEVAWARRSRCLPDDTVAILAGLWLRAARRDTGPFFLALCAILGETLEPAYRENCRHAWDEDEIAASADEQGDWQALWYRHALGAFNGLLADMAEPERKRMAGAVRANAERERLATRRSQMASQARRMHPARSVAAMRRAGEMGLTADDLQATELAFSAGIRNGTVRLAGPIPLAFLRFLDANPVRASRPDADEVRRRLADMRRLTITWGRSLSEEMQILGAGRLSLLEDWRNAERLAPSADPVLGFGVWLCLRGFSPLNHAR